MKTYNYPNKFYLESGKTIDNLQIAYHTFGKLNKEKNNVVWVFHAISANSNVLDWWSGLFGDGKLFSPDEFFIVCANTIGSPYGTTKPENLDFPQFSVRDVVNAHFLLADFLEIDNIHTAIGGSFGGNQALEFAYSFKGVLQNLVLIASSARESAWGIAIHESQRLAMEADTTFGQPGGGEKGMKTSRGFALLTYRTIDAYIDTQTDTDEKTDNFKASSYIQYQGDKFVKRFDAMSYYYLTKCLDSHNVGRNRGGEKIALNQIKIPTLVIGIASDVLIPIRFQKFIAENIPTATYKEIKSNYGHDGFLIETEQIEKIISEFYENTKQANLKNKRVVLKFGGKTLTDKKLVDKSLEIIEDRKKTNNLAVVVSARGHTTDHILQLLEKALKQENYDQDLKEFFEYQKMDLQNIDFSEVESLFENLLKTVYLFKLKDEKIWDNALAIGELYSAKVITELLSQRGIKSKFVDARKILFLHEDKKINNELSQAKTQKLFETFSPDCVPIITGFIATDFQENTATLGRNGSNYTATLIASYINAKEIQNITDVDGIYTANPKFVKNATQIKHISYKEAYELANFGANILHPKTILPLINNAIPLKIISHSNPNGSGTLIDGRQEKKGIKAVSVIENVSLVSIEGSGLQGKIGIDARIFSALSRKDISVRLISQASSERGIGFIVDNADAYKTEVLLHQEFKTEIENRQISNIKINNDTAIIAIVGRHNYSLEKAIQGLRKNRIWMHLISNSISGEHISLVIDNKNLKKAVNVVHNQVFGAIKTLNLFAFGKGTVGKKLINQILDTKEEITKERNLKINIVGIADSKKYVFAENGLDKNWEAELKNSNFDTNLQNIIADLKKSGLENIVVADNTASDEITEFYPEIIRKGFDIVASNKKANSSSYEFYEKLRTLLKLRQKHFYYETNVGAGLPIIDPIKLLHQSSDKITKIKGVFSGSLSYIFNTFSEKDVPFFEVLAEARKSGYTEPDPREDLCGADVARKLLILAREVGLQIEFSDIEIENLIPEGLRNCANFEDFWAEKAVLNSYFAKIKQSLLPNQVLRYVGEADLVSQKLTVSLVKANKNSPLGNIKNADSLIEIYTEGYGIQPIVIQGAGAGAEVTARGVYSDLLRIGSQL